MILKTTSVLASGRRRIKARRKDLVKVTVKFIRRGTGGRREREKHFLLPMHERRAKTQDGGHQLLVLYRMAGGIHVVKDNESGWLKWLIRQGKVTLPNHTQNPPKSRRQQVLIRTSLSLLSGHPRILVAC
jgi:hypothetical protein